MEFVVGCVTCYAPYGSPEVTVLFQVEEAAKLLRPSRMPKLAKRLSLNLTNPLTSNIKLLTNLFERMISIHINTKPHAQNLGFTWRQAGQNTLHGTGQAGAGG